MQLKHTYLHKLQHWVNGKSHANHQARGMRCGGWRGKTEEMEREKKNKPCIHESNGRHWWKSKWTPQGVEKKRTDTYPNLCYLATDLWTYSITSWLTKGITVGGGLRPIRLEYKNITPFFLNNRKWKVNTRLLSCCGHNKYILSHENQRVRPRRSPKP